MSLSGGYNANYGNVSVGASAVVIAAAKGRSRIIVQNNHATQILYLGDDANVTADTAATGGLKVAAAGASVTLEGFTGNVYGIASGASTPVAYFEVA
jgi:hypothetical protein